LNLARIHQHVTFTSHDDDITSLRPGVSTGTADVVSFGLFVKGFFGANLKHNKFTNDVIFALKWKDPRVISLVPAGMEFKTMSGKQALKSIWMPEIVVTNRDIRKWETIASTVKVFSTGDVFKVERAGVICNHRFVLDQFPFDTQDIQVKIASSKYMLDEVVLKPDEDKTMSGAKEGIWKGSPYTLEGWKVFAFAETDGALKKSRGVLELSIKRKLDTYWESHLMPTFMLLGISWGVFYFPFQNPFITPRLALSILALLSFTNIVVKSSASLPDGAPFNWNDVINQQVQTFMFFTICLNIFSEVCKHKMGLEEFAEGVNNHGKVLIPLLSIVVLTIILSAGYLKYLSLGSANVVAKVVIGVTLGVYITAIMAGLPKARAEVERKAAEKKAGEDKKKAEEMMLKQADEDRKLREMKQKSGLGGAAAGGAAGAAAADADGGGDGGGD
jgi:hypothetical protein